MPETPTNTLTLDRLLEQRLSVLDQTEPASALRCNPTSFAGFQTAIPQLGLETVVPLRPTPRSISNSGAVDDISLTQSHRVECEGGAIWVSGSSLLCACPDCDAPMTIRVWLGLADCWRCATSISLTESQMEAAEQWVREQAQAMPSSALPAPPPRPATSTLPVPPPIFRDPLVEVPDTTDAIHTSRHRELERLSRSSPFAKLLRNGFRSVPAWMVSFLIHMVIILILALILLGESGYFPSTITLSTFLSSEDVEGGDIVVSDPTNSLQDDLERASMLEADDRELRDVLQKANIDAQQLQVDPRPLVALPDITEVRKNITTSPDKLMSFAARDPRVRSEMVRKQGGTTITEAAVSRGLRWLASVQNQNGGWSYRTYNNHQDKNNESDTMGTSLALLPMLGAGQTHEYGRYKETVSKGLAWLIEHQKRNGDLRAGYEGNQGMYAHGQATIVLCEALALTGDQRFVEPAQNAIKFIEAAQHGKGGWRYKPGQVGDTSVFGWQMMALQSAKASQGIVEVDPSTLKLADYFLDQVQADATFSNRRRTKLPEGSAYSYLPDGESTPSMTAEAILCRMYLGWKKDDPRLASAVKWLVEEHPPSRSQRNLYYWYYGTQVMHHYGGEPWNAWNEKMRGLLIASQESKGRYAGSWDPEDYEWGSRGGRIYTTSLAVCTLEVYYRHLPIFHQIELSR